jgi:hypothetical protein
MRNIVWEEANPNAHVLDNGSIYEKRAFIDRTGNAINIYLWKRKRSVHGYYFSLWEHVFKLPFDTPTDEVKRVILAQLALGMDDGE